MAAVVLAIYLIFALLALGGRAWLQHRRTGDYGFRVFSVHVGPIERLGWFLAVAGSIGGLMAPIAELSAGGAESPIALPTSIRFIGLGLMLIGMAIALAAQLEMGASWRVGLDEKESTDLVTTGLFRLVRNPIFTAMLTVWIGIALATPNIFALIGLAAAIIGLELQVRRLEEPYLIRTHGERYLSYARRVGRFVPGVGKLG
jgi:protein-S-isoprenylcysteine O-methyltransferase Ste14